MFKQQAADLIHLGGAIANHLTAYAMDRLHTSCCPTLLIATKRIPGRWVA